MQNRDAYKLGMLEGACRAALVYIQYNQSESAARILREAMAEVKRHDRRDLEEMSK